MSRRVRGDHVHREERIVVAVGTIIAPVGVDVGDEKAAR